MRRVASVLSLTAAVFSSIALLGTGAASAHPLGNFTVNRYSGLVLTPGRIEVRYVLDLAEIPTFQERPRIDRDGDGRESDAERREWADRAAAASAAKLALTVNGRPVALRVTGDGVRFLPGQAGLSTLRLEASFVGELPSTGTVEFRDRNEPGRIGWREVTVGSSHGVAISDATVPSTSVSNELLAYPVDLVASPLEVTRATFSFGPGPAAGEAGLPGPPADSRPAGRTVSGSPVAGGGAFAGLVGWRLTPVALALSLLLAFVFGGVHALGPGHGKTIAAAYLVGRGARLGHAAAVGVAVALMHTASVLGLGLVLFVLARTFPADHVYPWLTVATGLAALALGSGLLVVRIRARRGRGAPGHGSTTGPDDVATSHVHVHGSGKPEDDHAMPERALSARGLVGLAVAGGILPSPTAFVVLTGAVAAHRVGYGLALVLAFSLGLASALVAVGALALRLRSVVGRRLGGRWVGLVPVASAAVIVAFGVFFAARGMSQIG